MKRAILKPALRSGILLILIAAVVWLWLDRMGDEVHWLTVEAPSRAVEGELLPLRVHVAGLKESSQLCVDLHWSDVRNSSKGFLASGGAKPVGRAGGNFDFEIVVRPTSDLRYVHGIIYLSPTGNWDDHTFVATTDLIPVVANRDGGESTLVSRSVSQLVENNSQQSVHARPVARVATGILLLIASVLAWMAFCPRETSVTARRWWLVLAVGLAAACAWELFGLESRVGTLAREWARAGDFYYPRARFQRAAISVITATAIVVLGFVWHRRGRSGLYFFSLDCM